MSNSAFQTLYLQRIIQVKTAFFGFRLQNSPVITELSEFVSDFGREEVTLKKILKIDLFLTKVYYFLNFTAKMREFLEKVCLFLNYKLNYKFSNLLNHIFSSSADSLNLAFVVVDLCDQGLLFFDQILHANQVSATVG